MNCFSVFKSVYHCLCKHLPSCKTVCDPAFLPCAKEENTFEMLKYQQQRNRPFGGREFSQKYNNIKLDIAKLGYGNVNCINMAQDMDHWQDVTNVIKSLSVS